MIRLDARRTRPWLRDTAGFRHPDLLGWVEQQRGRFVTALLTLARAWYVAGRPPAATPTVGGFCRWSQTVGGILAHAGVPGFLGNLETLYEEMDEEGEQWLAFLTAWEECGGQQGITTTELISRMVGADELQAAFPDAAMDRTGRPERPAPGALLRRSWACEWRAPRVWGWRKVDRVTNVAEREAAPAGVTSVRVLSVPFVLSGSFRRLRDWAAKHTCIWGPPTAGSHLPDSFRKGGQTAEPQAVSVSLCPHSFSFARTSEWREKER